MGIVEVEQNRLRQQEIEVRALVALLQHGTVGAVKWKAERKLQEIAYPEELAEKINKRSYEVIIEEDEDLSALFGDEA